MTQCEPNPKRAQSQPGEVQDFGQHILSRWSPLDASNEPEPWTPTQWGQAQIGRSPSNSCGGSRLWVVDVWAYEVGRIQLSGSAKSVNDSQVQAAPDDPSAYEYSNQHSRLKLAIKWGSSSGGTQRVIDIAQGVRLAVESPFVSVAILYPQPGRPVATGSTNPFRVNGPGYVLDTTVGGLIIPGESSPGSQVCTNTFTQRIPAGQADVPIFIPPGTRWLSAYQTSVGTALQPEWRLRRDVGSVGPSLGSIFMVNRMIEHVSRPGHAGAITSGPADPSNDRTITWVFELEI